MLFPPTVRMQPAWEEAENCFVNVPLSNAKTDGFSPVLCSLTRPEPLEPRLRCCLRRPRLKSCQAEVRPGRPVVGAAAAS